MLQGRPETPGRRDTRGASRSRPAQGLPVGDWPRILPGSWHGGQQSHSIRGHPARQAPVADPYRPPIGAAAEKNTSRRISAYVPPSRFLGWYGTRTSREAGRLAASQGPGSPSVGGSYPIPFNPLTLILRAL